MDKALKAITDLARGTFFTYAPFNMTDFLSTSKKKTKKKNQNKYIIWLLPVCNSLKSDQKLSSWTFTWKMSNLNAARSKTR